MKKQVITSIALGSAVAFTSLSVSAADVANPFSSAKLSSGYQLAEHHEKAEEGKCGEGKCGADKKADAKCGADKKADGKCGEGKCGADKKADGSCGADKKPEGSCGAKN